MIAPSAGCESRRVELDDDRDARRQVEDALETGVGHRHDDTADRGHRQAPNPVRAAGRWPAAPVPTGRPRRAGSVREDVAHAARVWLMPTSVAADRGPALKPSNWIFLPDSLTGGT